MRSTLTAAVLLTLAAIVPAQRTASIATQSDAMQN